MLKAAILGFGTVGSGTLEVLERTLLPAMQERQSK